MIGLTTPQRQDTPEVGPVGDDDPWQDCRDYQRIAAAIRWLEERRFDQPSLDEAAAAIGVSPFHFQRLFTRWAGVSPKRFVSWLTLDHARALLQQATPVLDTALEVGLSGPSRLHDLCVTLTAATPGDIASGGAGMTIRAGVVPTPFGPALAALTDRGLCALEFIDDDDAAERLWQQVCADWPAATVVRDEAALRDLPGRLFPRPVGADPIAPLSVLVKGSPFQVAVWAALLRIPPGTRMSYGAVAAAIGRPGASRAVGSALAANRIGYVIPCHRVLQASGTFRSYRWGRERRHAILGWETARLCAS